MKSLILNFNMKFDQLLKKNLHKIQNKQLIKKIINIFNLKIINREKLKLGAITFDIKEVKIGNFKLTEIIDIRFIRQDNTFEDSIKIDVRLNALKWKFDFNNLFALFFLILTLVLIIYLNFYNWYVENLYFLLNNDKDISCLKESFALVQNSNLSLNSAFKALNLSLNSLLIDFFDNYFYNN